LGGLLAVFGGERPVELLAQMATVSPYRGRAHWYSDAGIAIGVQSDTPETHWFVDTNLVVALHGYLHFAGVASGAQSAAQFAQRYQKERAQLLPLLRGEYALLIWDRRARQLRVYRDPMNGRFVHFSRDQERLLIATEVRQILPLRHGAATLAVEQLRQISSTYAYPEPLSPYLEIERFESGALYQIDTPLGRFSKTIVSTDLDRLDSDLARATPPEQLEQATALLEQAVRRTLGDGHHHVFLSGGLDSRLIYAAALRSLSAQRVSAISHRFNGMDCDESATIDAVHAGLSTKPHYLDYAPEAFDASLDELLKRCDYPIFLTSHLTQQLLEPLQGRHGDIVLGGFGGDEIFTCNPRAMLDCPLTERWRHRANIVNWLRQSASSRGLLAFARDIRAALTPSTVYQAARRVSHGNQAKLNADQARLRWFVLKRKFSTHAFYGMLEQLPASYGLELRMPFRDLDLCAFLQSIHPLGQLVDGDPRGLEKTLVNCFVSLPTALTLKPKVHYTQVVELGIRSWPEFLNQPYQMKSAMSAFVDRFIAFHSSQPLRK